MAAEQSALEYLAELIEGTHFQGKTFLAGGAVRDEIMGKPVKDIDIVVSLPNGGIEFAEWITKLTGTYKKDANPVVFQKFGTAKFNLRGITHGNDDLSNVDIEVVMTRGEKYEKGSRKPEVVYADLKDDAFRRDLTVNSLFKDIVTGEIKDLTGHGITDIKNGIVRTPMDPDQTFKDDPLRMLRAVRFAVKYDWKMPYSMVKALKKNASSLQEISKERIRDELNKILATANADKGIRVLSVTGLMRYIIPELDKCKGVTQNQYHKDDVYDHNIEVMMNTPPDPVTRLAGLLHDIGKPDTRSEDEEGNVHFYRHEEIGASMAERILTRLKYTNDEIAMVKTVVETHMQLKNAGPSGEKASDKQLRKFVNRLGSALGMAMKVMHADNLSHSKEASMPQQIPALVRRIEALQTQAPSEKPNLPINGNDIMTALGIKPGPEIKKLLGAVEDAWYENPNLSKDQALSIVRQNYDDDVKKHFGDVLNKTVRNPDTDNDILVSTALKYDKTHPARIAAMRLLQQARQGR